jgi:hypothetical protein
MPKIKLILAACAVALALNALTAAAASAATAGWMVNGTLLSGTKALATTASVSSKLKLKIASITIECQANTLKGIAPELLATNKIKATSLEFTECNGTKGECKLGSEKINTLPVLLEATLEGTLAITAKLKPETKTTIATVLFEGGACAIEGVQAITGGVAILAPTGQDERTLQQASSITTEASGELKVGTSGASVEVTASSRLASGESWSFL